VDKDDYLQAIYAPGTLGELPLVLTFDELLKNQEFVTLMRSVLSKLEKDYGRPVDMEFTIEITDEHPPRFILHLLQCRPLSSSDWDQSLRVPRDVAYEDVVFETQRMVPHGRVRGIRYVVLVDPVAYKRLPDQATRFELARLIGRLNQRLEGERFILMGPGRWGTSNVELGLKVTYADIHNSRALIEIAESHSESTLEVSYGTHFFQDLVETRIYPLPLYLDAPGTRFNRTFFDGAENVLGDVLPQDADFSSFVKVIDVPAVTGGRHLELVMDGETDHALAFLTAEAIDGRGSLT
jgi:pyruvate,water dikinase